MRKNSAFMWDAERKRFVRISLSGSPPLSEVLMNPSLQNSST